MLIFKKKIILIYIILLLSLSNFSVLAGREFKSGNIEILNASNNKNYQCEIKNETNNQKSVDELGFILYDLIQKNDLGKVNKIIDSYLCHKGHDKELVKYINSELLILNKEYDLAIKLYHEMLAQQPNMLLVELKLARALAYVKHYGDALSVYQSLHNKYRDKLSVKLTDFIDSQIEYLSNKNHWQGTIKLGSSYDFNLNEASNSREMHCVFNTCLNSSHQSIAGGKWHYHIDLSKRVPFIGSHSGRLSLGIVGLEPMKTVTTRKINTFFSGGYQFENITKKVHIQPILEAKWHDDRYYNLSLGGKVSVEYTLNDQVTLLSNVEYKSKTYTHQYSFNDGNKWNHSIIGTYLINPRLIVFGGIHRVNRKKQRDSDSYLQHGIRVGFLKASEYGDLFIITGYKQTTFKQFDQSLNVKRKDHNWYVNSQVAFYKNKILTFTPSIYFNSQLNNSTADIIYSFKQSEVGVNFTKKF